MIKKKNAALLMAGVMFLSLAGCGSKDDTRSTKPETVAEQPSEGETPEQAETQMKAGDYKIALIQQHQINEFQTELAEAAEAKALELGVNLTVLSADQTVETQIAQIEKCTEEKYDAILFEPVDPDALGDAAKEAADAGVVVINIVSACTNWEECGIAALSCGDNVAAGEMEMQKVADLLEGKGNIAILTGPSGDAGGLERMEGYENILDKYPELVQVVEPADCGWENASARSTVESWLYAYDLDAIICENDSMAIGAGEAVAAEYSSDHENAPAEKAKTILIVGIDGTPDAITAIKDGVITGTVSQDGAAMATNAIEAAVKLLQGESLTKKTILTDNRWMAQ